MASQVIGAGVGAVLQAIPAPAAKQYLGTHPQNRRTLLDRDHQRAVVRWEAGGSMGLGQSLRSVVGQFGGASDGYDDYADDDAFAGSEEPDRASRPLALVRPERIEFSLVTPQGFDDVQQIADSLRADTPVIVDLQTCGPDLSKRVIDFCSGLTYALDGSLEYLGEKVVLLAPHKVELSSEAAGGLQEGRFFNQV